MLLQDIISKELVERLDTMNVQAEVQQYIAGLKESSPQEILHNLLSDAVDFGLKLLAALAIYIIGLWLIGRIKKVVARSMERHNSDKAIKSFVQSLLSVSLTLILIILSVSALGVNTTSLAALLAAFGMALGMALSGAMSNFAGGVLLLVFKPFKCGDYVESGSFAGTVESITIFSTKIITPDNKVINIPNGSISNAAITNYSATPVRRVEWQIGTAYGTDVEAMRKACLEIMAANEKILTTENGAPEMPSCNVLDLKDSAVVFVIRCWVKSHDYWSVYFAMNNTLYSELPQRGIEFPFPQVDVHMK